ncbi:ribose-phosphate diphosphokinase [Ramlibacter sp. MMS24-I3-19]|uniref:ribose-phosphate diphosphokinase n=1 Tax=Ramlibacter sp. MMS24-I3-19 TaxID=3416606 RepID=UPI003D05F7E8
MDPSAPVLFAFQSSRPWAERVAARLDLPLAPLEERDFEDGEHKTRPLASVRGRDVFVLHAMHGCGPQGVNDRLCRLLFFIGALKDAAAASVTAVVPYLAYARKDRKTKARDPVTTRYVAALFEAVGTDRVVALDVHNLAAYQNAFRCRSEHLEASHLFASHFAGLVGGNPVAVVSPDAGGIKRAERFREVLAATLGRPVAAAFAEKHRSEGVLTGELVVGDVQGHHAIILDDLIATGGTLARTARACVELGATRVDAAATHGLFVGDAPRVLADDALAGIVVTDSVPPDRLAAGPARDKLTVLPTDGLVAEAIRRIHAGGSLVELLGNP